ncbi:two-component system, NtrC family, response regulator HydG [Malonomonas rubra DSM 5091]|uniref:Two-component system, NtrC family, response regulator HydG n=1 Tax=Malonomonas rubra DSM 5091 TaxID=1122189 RepID=A0A1M6JPQ3_MALRU|nr:sigma-54 dependent transcriptional regulator [Malonomonas rubra]SHJ48652.1 two-component system, NtrC family, response regulator HydG [Malonomonas rubra DSM 5091]
MNQTKKTLLLVDDDSAHRTMLKAHLGSEGYEIIEAVDGDVAVHLARERHVDLVLLDLKMQRMDGLEALAEIHKHKPELTVIIITAFSSVENAVEAMKQGAFDYVTKPVDSDALSLTVKRALDFKSLQQENSTLKQRLGEKFDLGNLIGSSQPMQELAETLALVAPADATVLITGESGTGKELVAGAVHHNSQRKDAPFIKVNCAALHENLLESELFGHEKGAFTGAAEQRKGRFELADKGTLFLDEIGDMSLTTQAKILRVLQEGEFERLGGAKTIKVDVRMLAATHKNLEQMAEEGSFRQDLFFRLSVVPLHLPPLRERPMDIPALAEHFLKRYCDKNRKDIRSFESEALEALLAYAWPGNIRELENAIERAVILCLEEQILLQHLPVQVRQSYADNSERPFAIRPGLTLKDMEKELILSTLRQTDNNRTRAAEILGITRQTLQNKLKEYGLT